MLTVKERKNFLICINVLEGRHYTIMAMDSVVNVNVGGYKKVTSVRRNSDAPFYNEYFVFEFTESLQDFLSKRIRFTVIQPCSCWKTRKVLGYFLMDASSVWNQPEHTYYHKWGILHAPKKQKIQWPTGYLKVDISIVTKGDSPRLPLRPDIGDQIEGHLLLPEGVYFERQRANYVFLIYYGEDLMKVKSSCCKSSGTTDTSFKPKCSTRVGDPSSSVLIEYADLKGSTKTVKNSRNPYWNRKIVLSEMFPPLCQKINISLKYSKMGILASYEFDIRMISNSYEEGFLPTFGPDFIHFYTNTPDKVYAGKVFMEIRTELLYDQKAMSIKNVSVIPIDGEPQPWIKKNVFAFATIHSVHLINKKLGEKGKPIDFELTFGNSFEKLEDHEKFSTKPMATLPESMGEYYYVPYIEKKPCLYIISEWPDARIRLYRINLIKHVYHFLRMKMEIIEVDLNSISKNKLEKHMMKKKLDLKSIAEELIEKCKNYLDKVKKYANRGTLLDCLQVDKLINETYCIIYKCQTIFTKNLLESGNWRKTLKILFNCLKNLKLLCLDVEECWPYVFVWMIQNGKKIGRYRINARRIIYSEDDQEIGFFCGKEQNIVIKTLDGKEIACMIKLHLWLSLDEEKQKCFEDIPKFYIHGKEGDDSTISRYIISTEKHAYICKVYLLQGRFIAGYDDSGLIDPFVRVSFQQYVMDTRMEGNTLQPFWNQTVIFKNVILDGTVPYLKEKPPIITFHVFDDDLCKRKEFVGTATTYPKVVLEGPEEVDRDETSITKMSWRRVFSVKRDHVGELFVYAELFNGEEKEVPSVLVEDKIPDYIMPPTVSYRLDVLYWGVRNVRKFGCCRFKIIKPLIRIECAHTTIDSPKISNKLCSGKGCNFPVPYRFMDLKLPEDITYLPPLEIKLFGRKSFGVKKYIGVHIIRILDVLYTCCDKNKYLEIKNKEKIIQCNKISSTTTLSASSSSLNLPRQSQTDMKLKIQRDVLRSLQPVTKQSRVKSLVKKVFRINKEEKAIGLENVRIGGDGDHVEKDDTVVIQQELDLEELDWWAKFYKSIMGEKSRFGHNKFKLEVYPDELEQQPEFEGLSNLIKSYEIYRGKRTGDDMVDEANVVGTFKGAIRLYRWPSDKEMVTKSGLSLKEGSFQDFPLNLPTSYTVRAYVIRALNIRPLDASTKNDAYCVVELGNVTISDRKIAVPGSTSPVFGRCFEMYGSLPSDSILTIQVWDRDLLRDDLIGQTVIDLENRLYSNNWAHCGISAEYIDYGDCRWRDVQKPSQILETLCKKWNLDGPYYTEKSVKIGSCQFICDTECLGKGDKKIEDMALLVLRRWREVPIVGCPLVPEHIETRSLYHPEKPGIEQGKLQMWVDIFESTTQLPLPPPVDITPKKPMECELRVIIWNTEEVILDEDNYFTGERKSDIYVKGWLNDASESQSTDVHYYSITGEGNFNWRFIFPFHFLPNENKIVIYQKISSFTGEVAEIKKPCILTLQIWDNDVFSPDDFLGTLSLELSKMPVGAISPYALRKINPDVPIPTINLFKTKRHRGWWAMRNFNKKLNKYVCTGILEAELEIVSKEDATKFPVGLGRDEPKALPKPQRPDISFNWFKSPYKAFKYILKRRKWLIIKFTIFLSIFLLILFGIYSTPTLVVKKILRMY